MVTPTKRDRVIKFMGSWMKEPLHIGALLIIIAVMITAGYFVWDHWLRKSQDNTNTAQLTSDGTPAGDEKLSAKIVSGELKQKDYASYQAQQQVQATKYLNIEDNASALRIINAVINNVPADKVEYDSYYLMVQVQAALKNTAQEKKYLKLYIDKVKAAGGNNSDIVDNAQKELDSLQ